MREKERTVLQGANISKTCMKCLYGAVNPKTMYCGRFKKKPDRIYFGGEECPYFEHTDGVDFEALVKYYEDKK